MEIYFFLQWCYEKYYKFLHRTIPALSLLVRYNIATIQCSKHIKLPIKMINIFISLTYKRHLMHCCFVSAFLLAFSCHLLSCYIQPPGQHTGGTLEDDLHQCLLPSAQTGSRHYTEKEIATFK